MAYITLDTAAKQRIDSLEERVNAYLVAVDGVDETSATTGGFTALSEEALQTLRHAEQEMGCILLAYQRG